MNMFATRDNFRLFMRNLVALIWVAFQFYVGFWSGISTIALRGMHIAFAAALVFLSKPMTKEDKLPTYIFDMSLAAFSLICGLYLFFDASRIMSRMLYITPMNLYELVLGGLFILLLIETCRRMLGMSMTIVCLVFIVYGFVGKWLPGILVHRGMNLSNMIELQFVSSNGIMSTAAGVSADTVFYFMIFGAFLSATPAGKLFISLARFVTRKTDGGEAKSMVIACGLFGMISGSAAANVASVGTLTYESVKDSGFRPKFAAAVLAIAGAGGQLIPPVMGAAAFLMADYVGMSYFQIVVLAIIPATLYILSLYYIVHYEAKKRNVISKAVPADELKRMIFKYFYLLLPLVLLVVMIANGKTVRYASIYSVLALLVLTSIQKDSRMNLKQIIETLISGATSAVIVAIPCAVAGIIVGILSYTSLGLTISALISKMAGNQLWLALLLTMILVIIMGMGMPTSAAYIMSATLLAPAMTKIGVDLVVAHFFIFYFANLSMITPPVALASYTAAGVAKTPFWETGIEAFKYSFIIFLIPYVFVYNPAVLGIGTPFKIVISVIPTMVGLWATAVGMIGFYMQPLKKPIRAYLIFIGLLMIVPETATSIIGIVGAAIFIIVNIKTKNSKAMHAADSVHTNAVP